MQRKPKEKQLAITLRKQGLSLREIQQKLHVSKSSLSLWLRDTPLAPEQMLILLEKRENSWIAAGKKRHQMRIEEEENEYQKAKEAIGTLTERDIFLIAITLYWGEGAKQRNVVSQVASIGNSDPAVLVIFYKWIKMLNLHHNVFATLFIHEEYKNEVSDVLTYWKSFFKGEPIIWTTTIYKKHIKNKPFMRYNRDYPINVGMPRSDRYNGLLRLSIKKSVRFNRFLAGCAKAIAMQCPVV